MREFNLYDTHRLDFERTNDEEGFALTVWIRCKTTRAILGCIRWWTQGKYYFEPFPNSVFTASCLEHISLVMVTLKNERYKCTPKSKKQ